MRNSRQSALPRAEHLAAAAEPQILLGDHEPVLGPAHHIEPLARRLRQGLAVEQDARGLLRAAADAAAQLMQLGKAEALGMLDDHDRCLRHIDADLDHGGRDQDRQRAGGESRHDAILVLGRKPAMDQPDGLAEARRGARRSALRRRRYRAPRTRRRAGTPNRPARRRRLRVRSPPTTSSSRSSGTVRVAIGFRPGGFSSSRDTSMSP